MQNSPPIRIASTLMLLREAPKLEVLMVRRNADIDHVSGAMVFPGGKVEPADADPGWAGQVNGWEEVAQDERALRIAALREAFEECGMIPTVENYAADPQVTAPLRAAMDRGEARFLDYLRDNGLRPDLRGLTLFSRWLTPPIVPKRFDTWFYVTAAPRGQVAATDGREAVAAEWLCPRQALDLAATGGRMIVFPTRMNLSLLGRTDSIGATVAAAALRPARIVQPEIETRGAARWLRLTEADGYGVVEEPLGF